MFVFKRAGGGRAGGGQFKGGTDTQNTVAHQPNRIFNLTIRLRIRQIWTLAKTPHISSSWTPIWTRPASFERADTGLSNDAGLVQIGVDHAEIRGRTVLSNSTKYGTLCKTKLSEVPTRP